MDPPDAPLKGDDLQKSGLIQFPTVMGGVVPAINLAGVEAGKLKLTGPILAEIYLGTIKKWNDPKITALNPDVTLPNANISPKGERQSSDLSQVSLPTES